MARRGHWVEGRVRWRLGVWSLPALVACSLSAAIWLDRPARTSAMAHPACFGAASRDPLHPCDNPALGLEVTPTPSDALLLPNAPCTPSAASIPVCTFGVSADRATGTIALLGDSHASHWRAALWVVADTLNWQGFSVTHSSCPFALAVLVASDHLQQLCIRWSRYVIRWFERHPEVSTVFTSAHSGLVAEQAPGESEQDAWVAAITAAWAKLPPTVKHIIVIRDDPFIETATLPCVSSAIAQHIDAGTACAFPREAALPPDPDVLAAERLQSPRVQVVDLTNYFCGSVLCYPVIGGVLVYKDIFDHITATYSTTLGPYLLRDVRALMKSWR
jgi:hypothetical protein